MIRKFALIVVVLCGLKMGTLVVGPIVSAIAKVAANLKVKV